MNISKKALMSVLMALTSLTAMAQPYYHIMKRDDGNLTEEAAYNAKKYKIKVDMVKPMPPDAIGGLITIESYECDRSPLKRSFYFTKHGNVYYNNSEGKFHFENSQLDYPSGTYSKDHCGHFRWGKTIEECIDDSKDNSSLYYTDATETDFYFANPENLPKLQEDLGNEKWAVLSYCEWDYVRKALGQESWSIDGQRCMLIDTTPGKSLLKEIFKNKVNTNMTKEEFEYYEAQGLVCLPALGERRDSHLFMSTTEESCYWSCTPVNYANYSGSSWVMGFSTLSNFMAGFPHDSGYGVRLVILADD